MYITLCFFSLILCVFQHYFQINKFLIAIVNVSELGLVTTSGKVAWGKMAQISNNPELDGCVNAVLLV